MKILIVEDEPGIANFIRQGLEEEGYIVTVATEGKPALKLLFDEKFDLVILDWMLPDLSGPEICREFREKDAATPIIFLTAKDTVQDTIDGLQAGANDYIKKPFHFVELLERIKVQWRNRTTETEILQLGDIQIDLQKYEVTKAGTPVNLTQKEFQLLEFLVRNKGRVSERTQIIREVWDIHFEYNTGVIDVFMNSLRKKLGITDKEYIQTIRGVGYLAQDPS